MTQITRNPVYRFTSYGLARSFTDNALKTMMVVLGDDGMFWAVTPADAARLVSQGYELAA